jgi:hypothetical protein
MLATHTSVAQSSTPTRELNLAPSTLMRGFVAAVARPCAAPTPRDSTVITAPPSSPRPLALSLRKGHAPASRLEDCRPAGGREVGMAAPSARSPRAGAALQPLDNCFAVLSVKIALSVMVPALPRARAKRAAASAASVPDAGCGGRRALPGRGPLPFGAAGLRHAAAGARVLVHQARPPPSKLRPATIVAMTQAAAFAPFRAPSRPPRWDARPAGGDGIVGRRSGGGFRPRFRRQSAPASHGSGSGRCPDPGGVRDLRAGSEAGRYSPDFGPSDFWLARGLLAQCPRNLAWETRNCTDAASKCEQTWEASSPPRDARNFALRSPAF